MASTLNLVPFPQSELQRSLSEESFGIKSFEFVNVSELEATANVVLLEGNTIQISLTSRGYQSHDSEGGVFETMEDLLQATSPMYETVRQRILMEKLSVLAGTQ
ncbi:hypothetical protein PHLCEN_2v1763 [Hermanssonia centrifuga]|uniref:GSKIP domain-containing protein n=1 Tax=Hermanssonia centrifuga TaxID=98765 RepID=A0A2R6RVZ7_9APHY|nr:hypothetical protein PHLCEN_2v1763 [Hermanssonia centrifuga]